MPASLLINGWFWGETHTGSGQYLHGLLGPLAAALPGWTITLLTPAVEGSGLKVEGRMRPSTFNP